MGNVLKTTPGDGWSCHLGKPPRKTTYGITSNTLRTNCVLGVIYLPWSARERETVYMVLWEWSSHISMKRIFGLYITAGDTSISIHPKTIPSPPTKQLKL
ncbi:hypothetical protein TorRG33x02_325000 [Trema orientale]|uniref:Uncharacterized protein n=1 Tax=Trema orientale TaxID=63057 RepID=A0A2P5BDG8_TREOI|nr:hypothetical protein TorRG33x02_325000 [Trema orientale]